MSEILIQNKLVLVNSLISYLENICYHEHWDASFSTIVGIVQFDLLFCNFLQLTPIA